uniref:Putative ixodegrin protein n=1 Tax=Ixodes ricinus TaxID=34613 RepID=A0A0K8R4T2_IXORI
MKTDFAALALTFVVASLLADVISSQGQRPVLPNFPGRPTRRPTPGREGDPCNPYAPCQSDLCCLKSSRRNRFYATCQPKAGYGMPCSEESIKGGTYTRHCPCLTGYCPGGPDAICLYEPK